MQMKSTFQRAAYIFSMAKKNCKTQNREDWETFFNVSNSKSSYYQEKNSSQTSSEKPGNHLATISHLFPRCHNQNITTLWSLTVTEQPIMITAMTSGCSGLMAGREEFHFAKLINPSIKSCNLSFCQLQTFVYNPNSLKGQSMWCSLIKSYF